ncbi:hypothetical protein [Streptomyces lateritius]|uniref:hypothetical protein n=1 Tax=Streptomyces lateritius TaxID=67313 RepID=UPI001C8BA224|nr:hypothetical protein [Streptomyces lateritius]MBX9425713.1 hypothetical protein [Streptomyces lateritius]
MAEQQDGGERDPQPIDEEAAWAAIVAGYGEEPVDPPGAKPFRTIETLSLPEPEDEEPDASDASGPSGPKARGAKASADEPGSGVTGSDDSSPGRSPAERSPTEKSLNEKFRIEPSRPASDAKPEGAEPGATERGDAEPEGGRPEDGPARPALGSSVVFAPGVRPSGPRDYSPADPEDAPGGSDEGHFVPPEPPPLPDADATTKFAWLAVVGGPVLMLVAVLLRWDMTWWLTTLCVGGFLGGFATLVGRMKHDDDDDDGFDDPGRGAVV